jgi:hypothetical protein
MDTEAMQRCRYKEHMTAASYVAHGLDPVAEERFELHLMECSECLDDVEAWRAIEKYMPRAASIVTAPAPAARAASATYWRLAASIVGVALIVGAASGWYGRMLSDPGLAHTAFFNAPPLERGADCTALRFGADTKEIALRIPGIASDRHVVVLSGEGELASGAYSARRQSDGSWVVQFAPGLLKGGALRLEARGAGAPADPVGCFSAASTL